MYMPFEISSYLINFSKMHCTFKELNNYYCLDYTPVSTSIMLPFLVFVTLIC